MKTISKVFLFTLCCIVIAAAATYVTREKKYKQRTIMCKDCMIHTHNAQELDALFATTPEQVKQRVDQATEKTLASIAHILELDDTQRTFENTVQAFDRCQAELSVAGNVLQALEMVSPDEALRNACHDAQLTLQAFSVDTFFDKRLYLALKYYADHGAKQEELTAQQRYYLETIVRDFERDGLGLQGDDFEKNKNLRKEISKLSLEFDANIAKDASAVFVTREQLAGVPDDFVENLTRNDQGLYRLGCDYPTFFEVIQNCSVADTRKQHYVAFQNRAYPVNKPLLDTIVSLRSQLAKLLGFATYAELDIDATMAKSAERVGTFLNDMLDKSMPKAKQEHQTFAQHCPDNVQLTDDGKFYSWDFAYVKEKYKKEHLGVDEREVAQYFQADRTLQGIMDVYQRFLGLKFELVSGMWTWHPDVQVLKITRQDSGVLLGFLYLDIHPRPNKYSHACHCTLIPGGKRADGSILPSTSLVIANFPKATASKPALLKFDDVNTFFHEFGHAMHAVVGATQLYGQSGTSVKFDFVEMPSQIFEEWLDQPEVLNLVSAHHATGEPLPVDIINALKALKTYDAGIFVVRQCWLALFALQLYQGPDASNIELLMKQLAEKCLPHTQFTSGTHFYASFGHLTGYSAKYYTYLWSKVFALDVFLAIKERGVLDPAVGKEFVDKILGCGGSAEPDDLLLNFLGRAPGQEAFLKEYGFMKK